MKNSMQSLIRHLLTLGGGVAVEHGYGKAEDWEIIIGGACALIGLIWGVVDEHLAERRNNPPPPKQGGFPQSPLTVAAFAIGALTLGGCAGTGGGSAADVERSLPYIRTGATLAMGAGLKYGVDNPADRAAIANVSWSVSHAVWTLTDGRVPTVDGLRDYLRAWNYELNPTAAAAYNAITDAIAALYANWFERINGNPELAVKVLNAIAEGAANGSAAYMVQN